MINKILVLSYYHPWISGGGHRPICFLEQDLIKERQVIFLFESDSELEYINNFRLYSHPNLKIIRRDKESGQLIPCNSQAEDIIKSNMREKDLFSVWKPDYVRSHNPVQAYIPLLEICRDLNIPHIYDQMDYWDGFSVKPWGDDTENKYIELSVMCTTISYWLVNHTNIKKNMYMIPNALKSEFLKGVRIKEAYELEERSAKKIKTVLYSGAIWPDWFDWKLVKYLIKNRPEYKFLFVGAYNPSTDEDDGRQVREIVKELSKLPNVTFIGQIPHSELVPILKTANVGIIPFIVNSVTEACSPLKCFEYIGASLPVVSTNLPEIKDYPLVKIAHDYDEFLIALDNCLKQKLAKETLSQVEEFLDQNTWETRSTYLDELVIKAIESISWANLEI